MCARIRRMTVIITVFESQVFSHGTEAGLKSTGIRCSSGFSPLCPLRPALPKILDGTGLIFQVFCA
jgi:hypothetical protein